MARYIDADALKNLFCESCSTNKRYRRTVDECRGHKDTYGNGCFKMRYIDNIPTADVVPKSEEGAECPTCHGTGRIGTTDWLTKNISKKQLAEEKAKAIAEHEQHIKSDVAGEIFEEIERLLSMHFCSCLPKGATEHYDYYEGDLADAIAELKKKYTEEKE